MLVRMCAGINTMENNMEVLKKLKIDLPYNPAIRLLGIYLKECDLGYYKGTHTPMFIVALFTTASNGNSQDAPLLTNGLRKCGICIQWNFTLLQRRMKFCHLQVNEWNWKIS
jgi:hypothetical protein